MLTGVTTSNGLDWGGDDRRMYYIDSRTRTIDVPPQNSQRTRAHENRWRGECFVAGLAQRAVGPTRLQAEFMVAHLVRGVTLSCSGRSPISPQRVARR